MRIDFVFLRMHAFPVEYIFFAASVVSKEETVEGVIVFYTHNTQKLSFQKCLQRFGFHSNQILVCQVVTRLKLSVRFNSKFINNNKAFITIKQKPQGLEEKQILCDMLLELEILQSPGSCWPVKLLLMKPVFAFWSSQLKPLDFWVKLQSHWKLRESGMIVPSHIQHEQKCLFPTRLLSH